MPLIILCIVFAYILITYRDRKYKKQMKLIASNLVHSTGTVYGKGLRFKNDAIEIKYNYLVDNQLFNATTVLYGTRAFNFLENQSFSLVYYKENPSLNKLLITEKDYKLFNLQQPEHLKIYNGKIGR